jgi:oxygen-independent coproporphyrinogen-3 oxidase
MTLLSESISARHWRNVEIDFDGLRRVGIEKPSFEFEKAHTYPGSQPDFQPRTPDDLFCDFKLAAGQRMWGYVHVPFCNYACKFCFYAKTVAKDRGHLVDRYLANLEREMDHALERLGLDAFPVRDLYVGGGTPTALDEEQMDRFLNILRPRFRFEQGALASVEGSPESLTAGKITLLKDFGFTRFSIGMQSENQNFLDFSDRRHLVERVYEAYDLLRESGVEHINVDLIYGFPGETVAMWEESLGRVLERIDPESLTLYYLRYVPGTWFSSRVPKDDRASWETLVEMRRTYMDMLEATGYARCRPHCFHKPLSHVLRYSGAPMFDHGNFGAQIGFGPSACSHLGHQIGRSVSSLSNWCQQVETVGFGTHDGRKLTLQDRMVRRVVKDLCNRGKMTHASFHDEFGQAVDRVFQRPFLLLLQTKLIEETADGYCLTPAGILIDEEIAFTLFPN